MGLPNIFKVLAADNSCGPASSNLVGENLLQKRNAQRNGFKSSAFRRFWHFLSGKKIDGGSRTEEEEKVYAWLYTLAQSEKDIVFEYVRSTERGLSFTEADRRLKENGPNIPHDYTFPKWWHLLWSAFFHPFNIILLVLSLLSFLALDSPNGCIMLVLVFISVSLRFYKEYSSSKAAMKLSEFLRCPVKVQRCAGKVVQTELLVQVDQRDIVPGDIIMFEPGDLFPGDVRLLTSKQLIVSQSSLTGEFGMTEKTADIREDQSTPLLELKNICFMGTSVISGSGTGLVVSTGSKTYMSTMFLNVRKQKPPDDFEKGIRYISYVLITVMLIASIIMVLADYFTSHKLSESIIFGISVASALTPQMLPLIVNTSLAKGALAMARDRCILKSLTAIRDMGSMDILCIDKTGTLTMNHAIMVNHLDSWGSPNEKVLHFGFLNAYFKTQQKYPLDDAIISYAYTNGYRFHPSRWTKIEEIAFDFTRRRVSVILEKELNVKDRSSQILNRIVITKGAPEEVIKLCSFIEHIDRGEIGTLTVEEHQRIQNIVEYLSNNGLRALGVAMKRLEMVLNLKGKGKRNMLEHVLGTCRDVFNECLCPYKRPTDLDKGLEDRGNKNVVYDDSVECNMVFLGLISFLDPPKDTAKQALWRLADKGVQAKVLTGDSLQLAISICKEVGIETTHVVTGPDLELLNHDSFHETVKRATVFARLTPTLKLRVVQSLQTVGKHVVGFLGDGVNDSLALDAANVGISVDSGTSIAKDLADIILLEKDLNVLVAGVEHGRLTFANTMKYIKMSVIANIGSILSLLIATLVRGFEPLTPSQLLTQYFLYNVGQIAIPWDNIKEDYVKTPQKWSLKGLAVFILWNAPVCTLADASTILFVWFYYKLYASMQISFFRSAWFVEGLLMQTLIIHMIRTEKIPFIQEAASWPVICSTVVISAIGISVPYSPIGHVMEFMPLPLSYFVFLVVLFVGYFTVGQLVKRSYILVYKTWL